MRLVVGLGNPGDQYAGTRHNIGFEVLDKVATERRFEPWRPWKNALVARGSIASIDALLVKPQTYMNLSGNPVGTIAHFYKIAPAEMIVVHDELDFPPGQVRLKQGGGHGGHNGLRSIVSTLGADFLRIRLGIGKPVNSSRGADYVLSRFDAVSQVEVNEALVTALEALDMILVEGICAAMNRYNRSPVQRL